MSSVAATVHSLHNMYGRDMETTTRLTIPLLPTLWTTIVMWMTLFRCSKLFKRQKRLGDSSQNLETKRDFTRKWISQRPEVITDIPETDRATEIDLEKNDFLVTKTFGVLWVVQGDKSSFRYSPPPVEFEFIIRNMLKKTASIFDPSGLLTPFIVRAKPLMYEAWIEALDWDEELPENQKAQWKKWFEELAQLDQFRISRCIRVDKAVRDVTIQTFCDASGKAYVTTTYTRHEHEDDPVSSQLVAAKTRLESLKAMSIPLLELMGALMGLRLRDRYIQLLRFPWTGPHFG